MALPKTLPRNRWWKGLFWLMHKKYKGRVYVLNNIPIAFDNTGNTDPFTITTGNVLSNDRDLNNDTLFVSKVLNDETNVGATVAGDHGGLFIINSDGDWSFDPNGEFSSLSSGEYATTSIVYHVSDGELDDTGTLSVIVEAL